MKAPELEAFAEKVVRLKAEGLSVTTIAERLGVHRNTVNDRLRAARRLCSSTGGT